MSIPPLQSANVLVVEDNPIDAVLISIALKAGGFLNDPTVVEDGRPAIQLLQKQGFFSNYARPDLVILDLNLKQMDGSAVLEFIRQTPDLMNLRVAILSSSPADVMVRRAFGANGYFSKPSDLDSYERLGKELVDCYMSGSLS